MRTVDNPTQGVDGLFARLERDLKLLRRIARIAWQFLFQGRDIRARYADCQKRGEVYWVDEDPRLS